MFYRIMLRFPANDAIQPEREFGALPMIKSSEGRRTAASRADGDSSADAESPEASTLPVGRALHRGWVEELARTVATADLSSRETFHHLMWLIMALGGNQTAFAERHGYQPTTVSRWVNGAVAPPRLRRRPIILDAMEHLQTNLMDRIPVPLRDFSDEEADPALRVRSGRPVRRPAAVN